MALTNYTKGDEVIDSLQLITTTINHDGYTIIIKYNQKLHWNFI